ncbi:enolase [Treponema sp. OttesenSCG-928-L16]|nr:enolase [Treponema sp. OttesenSCG-928-L16]
MVITDVVVENFLYPSCIVYDANGHIHPGEEHLVPNTLLRIVSDEGIEGCAFGVDNHVIEAIVKPILLGENPLCREYLWKKLQDMLRIKRRFIKRDLCVIDTALWDLAGKYFNTPVYQLLGGNREKVKAYASTMCGDTMVNGLSSPRDFADFALRCREQGYGAFKMHLWMSPIEGAPDWKRDLEACRTVKEAVGDTMRLMVDCSGSYNRLDAYNLGKELAKLDFYWMEEPVDEAEISSYVWLRERLDIHIIGPENPIDVATRAEWIIRGASDINRCGAQDVGGITPLLKAVHLFEVIGMPFDMHMSDPGNLQVLGVTTMSEYYERGLLHPLYDYEKVPAYLNSIFDPMDNEGFVHIPDIPGVGLDINYDYIRNNPVG